MAKPSSTSQKPDSDMEDNFPDFPSDDDNDISHFNTDNQEVDDEYSKAKPKISHEAKIVQLLANLHSVEFKIHSEAAKEFIKLLRGDGGGELLNQFVQATDTQGSVPCKDLLELWKQRQGKSGVAYVLNLISEILSHPDGKYRRNDRARIVLSRKIDKVCDAVMERMEDVYVELNSKEGKQQNAALAVITAIIRRGVGYASQVVEKFDFKLAVLPKLAEYQKKMGDKKRKTVTRHSFIEFAMSLLEMGNPRLLRWVLQVRGMYYGVLRGLASDDDETIVYVLSTLRDRVLIPQSLVPPSLRSVLFGSVTLEQLIHISGNPDGEPSAKIAHEVLVMVCTDPSNGLMPDLESPIGHLKGNRERLLELMKKLRPTEIGYHRELLLAIVRGRPSFGSAYMDEFPFLLEPRASSTWFSAISLASDLVSATRETMLLNSLSPPNDDPPSLDSFEMQCLLKCTLPRAFSRIVINRGLLHSDIGVRHGSLRLLLEALKSLNSLIGAIDCKSGVAKDLVAQKWTSLRQKIQDEARALLPDSQVLYKLLPHPSQSDVKIHETSLKRPRKSEELPSVHSNRGAKKLKSDFVSEDIDIIVGGVATESDNVICKEGGQTANAMVLELEKKEDSVKAIAEIWGLHNSNFLGDDLKDAETYFHSKLLDALTLYLRTMPMVLDGSYDFFKVLPSDPFTLSISQQQSLLSLLIEYIGWSPRSRTSSFRPPDNMYKHLRPLLDLLIHSPVKDIQDQAYILAKAAILSTGVFDRNLLEIDAWLLFLPGYRRNKSSIGSQAVDVIRDSSKVVMSFLCDAISTVGNNRYKYMDTLRSLLSSVKESVSLKESADTAEVSPSFSPLFICNLQKCLRLLESDSGTFKLFEKSMVSMYVCNALSFILQTQVDGRIVSSGIDSILTKGFNNSSLYDDSMTSCCEWRPLKNLQLVSRRISDHKTDSEGYVFGFDFLKNSLPNSTCQSFSKTLGQTKKVICSVGGGSLVGAAKAFCSSIVCASPAEILENFPSVLTVSAHLLGANLSLLSSIFFHEGSFLVEVVNRWPDIFLSSLELLVDPGNATDGKNDALVESTNSLSSLEGSISSIDFDSIESTSAAFRSFLRQASFFVLFPAIMGVGNSSLLDSSNLLHFLQGKLSEVFLDDSVTSIRLILFWANQIQSSYRVEPLCELEKLSKICFLLIKDSLGRLFVMQSDLKIVQSSTATSCIQEIAETIFHHPAVLMALSDPLLSNKEFSNGILAGSSVDFLDLSNRSINPISNDILHLLTTVADHLLGLGKAHDFISEAEETNNIRLVYIFKTLVQRVILMLKEKLETPMDLKQLRKILPSYYVLRALIHVIPPFMLLELVEYIFESSDSIDLESVKIAVSSISCDIANNAFDLLSCYAHQLDTNSVRLTFFLDTEAKRFNTALIENVYRRLLCFATHFKVECADSCILKAVNVVYKQKVKPSRTVLLPYSMAISRVILSSPISLIGYCIQGITATKAKILFQITELSPLHLTLFGQMFLSIRYEGRPLQENVVGENFNYACTDEQFIRLLPVAVSYLEMNCLKFGVHYLKHFHHIPAIYSKILLNGFRKWKSYTCGNLFKEEYRELSLSSTEELLSLFSRSLLGKAIHMLQYGFSLDANYMKVKKRMKLFDSICTCPDMDDNFMDLDDNEIDTSSLSQSLNFINRVIAKISLCRMLLFPKNSLARFLQTEENGNPEDISSVLSFEECAAVVRLIDILVRALHKIVKRFPLVINDSVGMPITDCSQLFRHLELFILRNIFELSVEIEGHTTQMSTVTFVEDFARSSLVHRFEDPYTIRVLRAVLISLCEGKSSCAATFELLLAHSKFIPSITWSGSKSDSSDHLNSGMLLRPMHSVLKSQFPLGTDQGDTDNRIISIISSSYRQKLEIIKLLRVLYHLRASPSSIPPGEDAKTNAKELLSLLLSCYGATVSEVDLEIFDLMHEIVSTVASDCVNIAEMDYLWGTSALKLRERKLEDNLLSDNTTDSEAVEERRRRQFRENIALDFKICAATILNYPFDRVMSHRPIRLKNSNYDDLRGMQEDSSTSTEKKQQYDPAFILRFSIHSLSMGYLNPLEFAGLGLLAIAFMSVSSPDEGIRKLGYEVLGRFKNAVLSHQKKTNDLRLLLTNLQMEITEPWQRVPSMTALFVAEASLILLDPSHDKFETMKKQISSKVNFKCIPLFKAMFQSVSRNFKTDRLWILRLSHAGLNFENDAQIFIRKGIIEVLLSFYSSSLSDYQSKTLIFQIFKKSMKFPILARHLVQKCNLISWMSSVLASFGEQLHDSDNNNFLTQTTLVLEVLHGVLSTESLVKWLKEGAFEQLSELSLHALKVFMGRRKTINEKNTLITSVLQILISTLRISQERELDHPHFTLSYDDLFLLSKTIDHESDITIPASIDQLVLKAILMCTPPAVLPHKVGKLLKTITCGISTASKPYCHKIFDISQEMEESIMTKLLRWVTASIILGTISDRSRETKPLSSLQTLGLFLENTKSVNDRETLDVECCDNDALAGIVLYLQQLLGMNCKVLPSVVCALCLLLLPHGSSNTGVLALDDSQIDFVTSMCSKIRFPVEANPAWRWCYDKPWGYTYSKMTEVELEEHQACESLLLMFSNALKDGKLSSSSKCLSYKDLEKSGVFKWEKNVLSSGVSS
ncbi:diphosphoinositol-polyphosphate diphosphatase [Ranunculus cassubicifolius]